MDRFKKNQVEKNHNGLVTNQLRKTAMEGQSGTGAAEGLRGVGQEEADMTEQRGPKSGRKTGWGLASGSDD